MNNKEHLHVEIFGKPDCIHCEKAKFLCNQKGIKYTYKELDKDFDFEGSMVESIEKYFR